MTPDEPSKAGLPGAHATSSPDRTSRHLDAPVLLFDLAEDADKLRQERPWLQFGRNAVTLVKYDDFRIVLMLMKGGTRLQEHHASGRISVQTLSGHVRLHLKEKVIDLPAGHLLALERGLSHDLEAMEESAVLLTIAWPGANS